MRILLTFLLFLAVISDLRAQSPLEKLYGKTWVLAESSILRPNRNDVGAIVLYSRGSASVMNLENMRMTFYKGGKLEGFDAENHFFTSKWSLVEGFENKIQFEMDGLPTSVALLTDKELILQIPQTYKYPDGSGEESVITQDKYLSNDPLPVTLAIFSATKLEKTDVLLYWRTSEEDNSDRFEIQYSKDAKNFVNVGEIPSKGMPSEYTFIYSVGIDNASHYFRLKLIDSDESYAFSVIRSVGFQSVGQTIFPNPAREKLSIRDDRWNEIVSMRLLSVNNQRTYELKPISKNEVSLEKLPPGEYIVITTYKDNSIATNRLVIH